MATTTGGQHLPAQVSTETPTSEADLITPPPSPPLQDTTKPTPSQVGVAQENGKSETGVPSVSVPTPPPSALLTPSIRAIDPQAGAYLIPLTHIKETAGSHDVLNTRRNISLCILYQNGSCKVGDRCHQLHADTEFVSARREIQRSNNDCCLFHGDLHSKTPEFTDLKDSLTVPEGASSSDFFWLYSRDHPDLLTVPRDHFAVTLDLSFLLTEWSKKNQEKYYIPIERVCGLHQKHMCLYGPDCKFIHLCREVYQSLVLSHPWLPYKQGGNKTHKEGTEVRARPVAPTYSHRNTSRSHRSYPVTPQGNLIFPPTPQDFGNEHYFPPSPSLYSQYYCHPPPPIPNPHGKCYYPDFPPSSPPFMGYYPPSPWYPMPPPPFPGEEFFGPPPYPLPYPPNGNEGDWATGGCWAPQRPPRSPPAHKNTRPTAPPLPTASLPPSMSPLAPPFYPKQVIPTGKVNPLPKSANTTSSVSPPSMPGNYFDSPYVTAPPLLSHFPSEAEQIPYDPKEK